MSTLPGSHIEKTEYPSRHLVFPTNPMYKGVWNTHITGNDADWAINKTIDWFKSRNAPFFFWWTGPGAQPVATNIILNGAGVVGVYGIAISPFARGKYTQTYP
jgi:hypothetical protein